MADDPIVELKGWIRELHLIPGCGTGGPLHIVTDDPNYDDYHLDFCFDQLFARLLSEHEVTFSSDPHAKDRGWWRRYQNPEDTARMIELGAKVLWGLRALSVDERKAVCGV